VKPSGEPEDLESVVVERLPTKGAFPSRRIQDHGFGLVSGGKVEARGTSAGFGDLGPWDKGGH